MPVLDAATAKLFVRLDSDFPAERVNALELLVDRFKKQRPPVTFRELAAEMGRAVSAQDYAVLENRCRAAEAALQPHVQANQQAQAAYAKLQNENARLKAALAQSGRSVIYQFFVIRPLLFATVVVLMIAGVATVGGQRLLQPAPEPELTFDAADQLVALVKSWRWYPGQVGPVVRKLDGQPWWVMATGDEDKSSFVNDAGVGVILQCFHYFARPATAVFGSYLKPPPVNKWQERGRDCRPVRTAAK